MSAHHEERWDFAVARHAFSLPGGWAWLYGATKGEASSAERVEICTEHAVMVFNTSTHPFRVRREPAPFVEIPGNDPGYWVFRIRQGYPLSVRRLETGVRNGKDKPASRLEDTSH